jgi:hypothetical protein
MDFKHYHLWGNFSMERIIEDNPARAIIFAAEETEISPFLHNHPLFPRLADIDLDIVFGSFNTTYTVNIPANARVHQWPTLWCNRTYAEFNTTPHHIEHKEIKTLYICLNNKAHNHRCMLLDNLSKYDILKYGSVTWHEPNVDYKWQYWNPKHLVLDEKYPEMLDSYKTLPEEFTNTLFSLVAESTSEKLFITEKTWTPILFNKPVLIFGAKDINKNLESLGIELYNELFDYSFDSCVDIQDRLEGIMVNIQRLSQMNLQELRDRVDATAKRNHNRMIEIVTSKEYVPEIVYNHMQALARDPDLAHTNDFRYLEMYNRLK